ncbi:hypothetical protein HDV00_006980, partial [Rhizophlyctis rosea]
MFTVAIITVSDRVSAKQADDRSGPALSERFAGQSAWNVVEKLVVPDETVAIQDAVRRLADGRLADLIITSGGTGFGVRDVTPEAISPLLHKQSPGLVHLMLSSSLQKTPMAALCRPICGVRHHSLILTLPGSVKGATENLDSVMGVLHHAVDLARGERGAGEALHQKMHGGHIGIVRPVTEVDTTPTANAQQHHHHHHHDHHHHHHHHADITPPVATRARSSPYPMISFAEAVSIVLSHATLLPPVKQRVSRSLIGSVLAEDVVSKEAVPAYRASIVDGYAVVASDGPGSYPVITSSTAGSAPNPPLQSGQIARITTGAPVPDGATAVVMVEYTEVVKASEDGKVEEVVKVNTTVRDGEDIREVGSDVAVGDVVLEKGQVVTAVGGEVGVLASVGVGEVLVHRKPVVAILSTGNEVKEFDSGPLPPGAIRDSNRPTLASTIQTAGFDVLDLGVAGDTPEALETTIRKGLEKADVIVTTGGVSMGELDLLKPVLEKSVGAKIHFGRVALKPGKPTTFATVAGKEGGPDKLVFALPGNPVSAT